MKDNNIIFKLLKSGELEIIYPIWDEISNMFSLDYYETQDLIKEWMEQNFGLEKVIPRSVDFF
jgi:hypothetical protein